MMYRMGCILDHDRVDFVVLLVLIIGLKGRENNKKPKTEFLEK